MAHPTMRRVSSRIQSRGNILSFTRDKPCAPSGNIAHGRISLTTNARHASHRTYFQPDSHVNQQHYQSPPPQYKSYESQSGQLNASSKRWTLLLVGFIAFPISYAVLENAAVRGLLPESLVELIFPHYRFLEDMATELNQHKDAALHQNDMLQTTHRVLRDHLTTAPGAQRIVVRDDDIIARRPIYLDDGQQVAAKDACLLRVMDEADRNTLVVLGVDLDAYCPRADRADSDLQGLHRWLYQLVTDMHDAGATAFSTEGETMYVLYTNNAIAMGPFFASTANGLSSHTEITTVDSLRLPPGWPLQQLRRVEPCETSDARVKAADATPPGFTAEGLLGSDVLPRGPFR